MIIKRVHFKNFRILRDVVIDFSDSEEKNLTVVRAENESGKTTVLLGLQWAFFSSKSLPKESDFRLYPINWDFDRFPSVKIEIEIDFEHSTFRPTANGGTRDVKRDYRLIRIAEETQEAQSYEEAALYEIKPQGTIPIEPFELKLQEMLPLDLREVFFTDGDRALSFIEADISRNDKRERVRGAVRSLLGLNIVENAESHVEEVFRSLNKQVKKQTDDIESNQISSELSNIDERLDTLIQEKKKLSDDLINIDLNINKVRRRLDSALIKGDKEELQKQLNSTEKSINQIQNEISKVEHLHTSLFKDEAVFYFLLKPLINSGITELQKQKDAGTIPKNTVPVLEERLECSECLCGESLDNNTVDGKRRRAIILRKIEEQKHRDRLRDTLTTIYYQTKGLTQKSDSASGVWLNTYKSIQERQDFLDYNLEKSESDYKDIDKKIDEIGDVDVNMLRTQEKRYRSIKTQISIDSQSVSREIKVMENRKIELSKQLESTLKKREKTQTLLSEMTVVRDVQDVFRETHSIIMNQELMKVSDTMNEYFIEMILADPDQKSIIRKTEITPDFDIVVYGPERKTLDPDIDLNGASRRALTISFILALANVSGVSAPNIIDTPLGMTAGLVRRSILEKTIEHSNQLILFLTRSEIEGCQDILNNKCGKTTTLSNTSHHPRMLVNPGPRDYAEIVVCDCDHEHVCHVCERTGDRTSGKFSFKSGR